MGRAIKIFHLEDSKIAQKILKKILGNGVDIIFASSKEEALNLLLNPIEVDCFIVDYSLFDGTGIEFIKHIREIEKFKKTPILFQSSNLNNGLAYKAMKAGANESISKLISSSELREKVVRQIKNPYIVDVILEHVEVLCITWIMNGEFYQYCPEFNIQVRGSSTVDAEEKMREKLKEVILTQEGYGLTKVETFIHHIKLQ